MTTLEVINHLYKAGLSVTLQQGERINLKPTNLVTPVLFNLVKFHKQALIKYFKEKDNLKTTKPKLVDFHQIYGSDPLLEALLERGDQICDYWNDSKAARAEMRSDILSYPPHQREALMATLEGSLRAEKPRFKTRQEEVRFTQRIDLFFGRVDAKELAQRLMLRDREQDDRRLCLECRYFKPHRLECNNFEWAGFTQPKLGSNWVSQLQRCLGFEEIEI